MPSPSQPLPTLDEAPRDWAARVPFFYGWVMVWVTLILLMFSGPGQTWLLGQFTNRFLDDFGLDKGFFNIGYSVATLIASLPMPFLGAWMDRFGLKKATIAAAFVILGASFLLANAKGPIVLFTAVFMFRLGGQGALAMISGHAIAKWFRERLGGVEGIRHALNGAFISIAPPFVVALIAATGWRPAIVIVGVITVLVIVPMMIFLFRESPAAIGQEIDGGEMRRGAKVKPDRGVRQSLTLRQAIKTRAFWVLSLTPCVAVMASTAVLLNLQPMMSEVGVNEERSAILFTVFAGVNVPLQFFFGWLVDRVPSWVNVMVSNGALALGCLLMVGREWWAVAILANATLAFCHGALWSSNGALLVRYFGLEHQGAIRGVMTNIIQAGSASGPFLVGAFVAITDAYDSALVFFANLAGAIMLLAMTLREPDNAGPLGPEERVEVAKAQTEMDAEEI
ncbi:MAG: MFS transporter [Planctomycetota bacterium]